MLKPLLVRVAGGGMSSDAEVKLLSVRRLASHHVTVESEGSARATVIVRPPTTVSPFGGEFHATSWPVTAVTRRPLLYNRAGTLLRKIMYGTHGP